MSISISIIINNQASMAKIIMANNNINVMASASMANNVK
jgi:hypothetical protein